MDKPSPKLHELMTRTRVTEEPLRHVDLRFMVQLVPVLEEGTGR
jgi:hypothetical protein